MASLTIDEVTGPLRWRSDLGLVFDPRTGVFHRVRNRTAHRMLELAFQGLSREAIADELAGDYGVPVERVANDLQDLFNTFVSKPGNGGTGRVSIIEIDKRFDTLLRFPLRLEIELTAVCNWNCGFCYNVWKIDPLMSDSDIRRHVRELPTKHISTDAVKRLLDECASQGCFVVRYSGGETLLHPDAMEIFEYGGQLGLYQVVFTNGHFVTPDVALRMSSANVRCALVSIHGDEATHNHLAGHKHAYERAIKAMESLREAGIDVVAELTLVADNVDGVLDVIRDVYRLGVRQFGVMRYVPTGKNDTEYGVPIGATLPLIERIDRLVTEECPGMVVVWPCAQKLCTSDEDSPLRADDPTLGIRLSQIAGHCESGLVWGSVSYDGQLRNCPHSNVYFGDVREQTLGTLWPELTSSVHAAVTTRSTCVGCAVSGMCRGGCHLDSFSRAVAHTETALPMPTATSTDECTTVYVT